MLDLFLNIYSKLNGGVNSDFILDLKKKNNNILLKLKFCLFCTVLSLKIFFLIQKFFQKCIRKAKKKLLLGIMSNRGVLNINCKLSCRFSNSE